MTYFTKKFSEFFKGLAANNNKEWFAEHKKVYEAEVKEPFKELVEEMIKRIKKHQPEIDIAAADAIFRINKDIRFSKDKSPYKTSVSANISSQGRKSKEEPGFYFELSPEKVNIYGGAYMVEPASLYNIRKTIAANPKAFATAYNDKAFKEKYGSIQGEKNKKLSEEFMTTAEKEPLIYNKQFYYGTTLKPAIITQDDLPDVLMEYYKAGKKMNEYLAKALAGK